MLTFDTGAYDAADKVFLTKEEHYYDNRHGHHICRHDGRYVGSLFIGKVFYREGQCKEPSALDVEEGPLVVVPCPQEVHE